jgi:hypothetical protein
LADLIGSRAEELAKICVQDMDKLIFSCLHISGQECISAKRIVPQASPQ